MEEAAAAWKSGAEPPAFVAAPPAFRETNDAARVRSFGEVFTPRASAEKMLALLDPTVWEDADATFLEPTCGDGAFLVPVVEKRYRALLGSAAAEARPPLSKRTQAMALALDSSFGFDIQEDNVGACRANLLRLVVRELPETVGAGSLGGPEWEFLAWACAAIAANVAVKDALAIERPPVRFSRLERRRRAAACDRMMEELLSHAAGRKTGAPHIEKALRRPGGEEPPL